MQRASLTMRGNMKEERKLVLRGLRPKADHPELNNLPTRPVTTEGVPCSLQPLCSQDFANPNLWLGSFTTQSGMTVSLCLSPPVACSTLPAAVEPAFSNCLGVLTAAPPINCFQATATNSKLPLSTSPN